MRMEEQSLDTAVARAVSLLDRGRHREAIPLLERALAEDPHDEQLLDLLATAQLEVDAAAAFATARTLVAVDPEGVRGPLLASFAADRLGNATVAADFARRAVELAPGHAMAHAQLAQSLVGKRGRRLKEARRAAQTSIALAPDSPVGYVTAGNVELGRGRARHAAKLYRQALEVDPTNQAAQMNVALTHAARDRLGDAFGGVHSVLRLDPADAEARRILDHTVYSTLVHLQWVVLALVLVVALVRG
jgi:predicted Zn-dependent protease